jgi:hypothetical protein
MFNKKTGISGLFGAAFIFLPMMAIANTGNTLLPAPLPSHTGSGASEVRRPFIEYHQPTRRGPAVTMISDRGPIQELTITCGGKRFGIVSYSKSEKLFCDPRLKCDRSFQIVYERTCGR